MDQPSDGLHGLVDAGVADPSRSNASDHLRGWRVDAGVTNHEAQPVLKMQTAKVMQVPRSLFIAHRHGAFHDPCGRILNTVGQHHKSAKG